MDSDITEHLFEPPVVEVADTSVLADRLDASVDDQLRVEAGTVHVLAAAS